MRELWGNINSFMETRWQWPLFVQRLRTLLQNEWHKQATHQAQKKTGKYSGKKSFGNLRSFSKRIKTRSFLFSFSKQHF